jgi:hypothetical protein
MLDGVADRNAESKQDYLTDSEKRRAEQNIANWPAIFKSAKHEDELRYDIDNGAD